MKGPPFEIRAIAASLAAGAGLPPGATTVTGTAISTHPAILRYYPRSCCEACAPPGASAAPALSPLTAYR